MSAGRIKNLFHEFEIYTVRELKWTGIKNGSLLRKAVENGFDIFMTVDKKLIYQQNIKVSKISIIILDIFRNKIEEIKLLKELIVKAFNDINPSEVFVINLDGIEKIK